VRGENPIFCVGHASEDALTRYHVDGLRFVAVVKREASSRGAERVVVSRDGSVHHASHTTVNTLWRGFGER
jgi:hypothetical protein